MQVLIKYCLFNYFTVRLKLAVDTKSKTFTCLNCIACTYFSVGDCGKYSQLNSVHLKLKCNAFAYLNNVPVMNDLRYELIHPVHLVSPHCKHKHTHHQKNAYFTHDRTYTCLNFPPLIQASLSRLD